MANVVKDPAAELKKAEEERLAAEKAGEHTLSFFAYIDTRPNKVFSCRSQGCRRCNGS